MCRSDAPTYLSTATAASRLGKDVFGSHFFFLFFFLGFVGSVIRLWTGRHRVPEFWGLGGEDFGQCQGVGHWVARRGEARVR